MGGAYRAGLIGVLLSASVLAGCGDSGANPGPQPTTIRITPSTVSFDAVGATATLTVQVLDQDGSPLPGAAVTWSSDDQGVATVTAAGVVTSRGNGTARLTARSGDAAGLSTVTVAQVGEALAESGGADQVGPAGLALATPLQVRATDRLDAPAVGVEVTFEVTEGDGSLSPATAVTDAQGVASSTWTLGPDASAPQRVRSRLPSGDFVDFTAEAIPGPPGALTVITGDQQTAPRSTALAEPLTVHVVDAFGNAVAGATVDFAVTAGTGSVAPTTTQTDADGNATAAWTLGPELGQQSVEATAGDEHLEFTATATTEPAALELSGGQSQSATVGSDVPVAPTVRVLDAGGLPVPGVEVVFQVASGDGSVAAAAAAAPGLASANGDEVTVQTDDQGEASAVWTLGTVAGAQSLEASVASLGSVVFDAQATAGSPASMSVVSGDGQSGAPTTTLAQPIVVEVDDGFGNPVEGVTVDFAVTGGGGALSPTSVATGSDGRASANWTMGPSNGPQAGEATAGDLQAAFTATAETVPAALVILAGDGQDVTVGTEGVPPSVRVEDAGGNPLADVTVTFEVTQGTSTLTEGANSGVLLATTTNSSGVATLDAWTMGTAAGVQEVTVSVDGVTPRIISATATAGPATSFVKVSGDGQSAPAGSSLPQPVVVRVEDAYGNPKSGVTVTFTPGSGSVLPTSSATNAQGQAQTLWTLASFQGTQFLSVTTSGLAPLNFSATATPSGGGMYSIELQYLTAVPSSQQSAFNAAASRWSGIITGDLPDVSMTAPADQCTTGIPAMNDRLVDDLLVFILVDSIDGVGKILGQAGPCYVRSGSNLTVVGVMRFDDADVDNMEANGTLTAVITHELGHILGIGSLWDTFGLLQDPSLVTPGADTYFSGTQAISAFDGVGGASYVGNKVPVENEQGGQGTRDSHWRESVFQNELMTGFINSGANPLSAVTIASLADEGYTVDLNQADSYTLPFAGAPPAAVESRPTIQLVRDGLGGPVYVVDSRGRVVRIIPR